MILKFNDFKLLKESIDNKYILSADDIEWVTKLVDKLYKGKYKPPFKFPEHTNFEQILKNDYDGKIPERSNVYYKAIVDYVASNKLPANAIESLMDYAIEEVELKSLTIKDKYKLSQKDTKFVNKLVKELCDSGYNTIPENSGIKIPEKIKRNPDINIEFLFIINWYKSIVDFEREPENPLYKNFSNRKINNKYFKAIIKYVVDNMLQPNAIQSLMDYTYDVQKQYKGIRKDDTDEMEDKPEYFEVAQNMHRPTGSDYFVYKNATFVKWNRLLDKPDYKSESVKLIAGDKVYNDIIGEIYDDADDAIDSINSELEGSSLHFQTKLNRRKQGTTFNNPIFTDILFLKQLIKFLYMNNDIRLTKNLLKDKFSSLKDIEIDSLLHNQSNMGIIEYDSVNRNYIINIEDEQEYQRILDVVERYKDSSYSGT